MFPMRIKRISSERSLFAMSCFFSRFLTVIICCSPKIGKNMEPGPEVTSAMVRRFFALDVTWYERLGGGLVGLKDC